MARVVIRRTKNFHYTCTWTKKYHLPIYFLFFSKRSTIMLQQKMFWLELEELTADIKYFPCIVINAHMYLHVFHTLCVRQILVKTWTFPCSLHIFIYCSWTCPFCLKNFLFQPSFDLTLYMIENQFNRYFSHQICAI